MQRECAHDIPHHQPQECPDHETLWRHQIRQRPRDHHRQSVGHVERPDQPWELRVLDAQRLPELLLVDQDIAQQEREKHQPGRAHDDQDDFRREIAQFRGDALGGGRRGSGFFIVVFGGSVWHCRLRDMRRLSTAMFELVGFVAGLVSLLLETRHRMREGIQGIVVDRGLVVEQGIRGLRTGGRRGRSRVGIGQRGMTGGVFLIDNGVIARSWRHGVYDCLVWSVDVVVMAGLSGNGEFISSSTNSCSATSHAIPCCTDSSARLD